MTKNEFKGNDMVTVLRRIERNGNSLRGALLDGFDLICQGNPAKLGSADEQAARMSLRAAQGDGEREYWDMRRFNRSKGRNLVAINAKTHLEQRYATHPDFPALARAHYGEKFPAFALAERVFVYDKSLITEGVQYPMVLDIPSTLKSMGMEGRMVIPNGVEALLEAESELPSKVPTPDKKGFVSNPDKTNAQILREVGELYGISLKEQGALTAYFTL